MLTVCVPAPNPVKTPMMLTGTPALPVSEAFRLAFARPFVVALSSTRSSKTAPVPLNESAEMRPLNVTSTLEVASTLVKLPMFTTFAHVVVNDDTEAQFAFRTVALSCDPGA